MQQAGHRKNPAAVALGRLGGLAGCCWRARRRSRRTTLALLVSIFYLLPLGHQAQAQGSLQGIFSYTFVGDTSPLNLSAAFSASWDAVSTGLLTTTNIISGYMQMGDRLVPIGPMYFPVNPLNGNPLANNGRYFLTVNGLFGIPYPATDWVEIDEGYDPKYGSGIQRDVYPIGTQVWRSAGWWHVALVPEPSSLSLLLLAIAGWQARRLLQRACR